jgi:hypothetical protein
VWFQASNDSMPGTSSFALPIGFSLGFSLGLSLGLSLGFGFQACNDSMPCASHWPSFAVCVIYTGVCVNMQRHL